MFSNYLKTAIRNIVRQRFYSIINIVGLAIGIACFVLIALWVQDELSYDRHFKHADRIYRIANGLVTDGVNSQLAQADPRIADHIREDDPGIGQVTRVHHLPSLLATDTAAAYEANTYYADTTFFSVFSYELAQGDAHVALHRRDAIVISARIAKKLFGNRPAIGNAIYVRNERTSDSVSTKIVTGVLSDQPFNAHFHADVLMSKYGNMDMFEPMYILFNEGYDPRQFETKIWPDMYRRYFEKDYGDVGQGLTMTLQPLTSIHLGSNLLWEHEPNASRSTVYFFSMIALFILLIAAINYTNLATASFYNRSREVIIRKIMGATKLQIIVQFLTESVALASVALILALSFVEVTLPYFNQLANKNLQLQLTQPSVVFSLLIVTVSAGLISGIYPAFFASAVLPVKLMNGEMYSGRYKPALRKILVVVQFAVSIVMVISTIIVTRQLNYVEHSDLGFNKDRVIIVDLEDPLIRQHPEALKAALLQYPQVLHVAASQNIPGRELYHFYHNFETEDGEMKPRLMTTMLVDDDYFRLMGLKFVEGSGFDSGMNKYLKSGMFVVVNEAAKNALGWKTAVGKEVDRESSYINSKGKCYGVVRDFHITSMHDSIVPMVFRLAGRGFRFLSVQLGKEDLSTTIRFVEKTVKSFSPAYPVHYSFLDQSFNTQYAKDEKQNQLFRLFAGLCIFISCLGLMGLTAYATRQRNKEISIRKISGASITDIVFRLSLDFIMPVIIAWLIAIPVSWLLMSAWLKNFAYHIEVGWFAFLIAGAVALIIAVITISVHTIKAAFQNPATVLKYE